VSACDVHEHEEREEGRVTNEKTHQGQKSALRSVIRQAWSADAPNKTLGRFLKHSEGVGRP